MCTFLGHKHKYLLIGSPLFFFCGDTITLFGTKITQDLPFQDLKDIPNHLHAPYITATHFHLLVSSAGI